MYDELVKVPLMIKFPDNQHAGEEKDELVELIDILPTIMDMASVEKPYYLQGQSLMDIVEGRKWNKEYVFIRHPHQVKAHALRTQTEKLHVQGNKVEYYNIKKDPNEKVPIRNMKAIPPEMVEKFKACLVENSGLAKLLGRGTKQVEMSKEEEDRLRSLGYIQ
jgi:arylsulfatase A-like enzyme